MRPNFATSLAAVAITFYSAGALAGVITAKEAGTTFNTTGISNFVTNGTDMVGLSVTATFAGGFTQTLSWASIVAEDPADPASTGTGGVFGNDWLVYETGTTFANYWVFINDTDSALLQLVFDGVPGDTIFDTIGPGPQITPGSADGIILGYYPVGASTDGTNLFDVGLSDLINITATYSNQVTLNGVLYTDGASNDLFTKLTLDFAYSGEPVAITHLIWVTDTDNTAIQGDLTPVEPAAVPEPSSLALLLGGGLLIPLLRRVRQNRGFST